MNKKVRNNKRDNGWFFKRFSPLLILLSMAIFAVSCSSTIRFNSGSDVSTKSKSKTEKEGESTSKKNDEKASESGNEIIRIAEEWIGTPYKYGGESKSGADCSGFVMMVYSELGIDLPRTSEKQYNYVEKIDYSDKEEGDLIFFKSGNKISHVGIYAGNGEMIHSSSSRGVIRQLISESGLKDKVVGAGKINYLKISEK